MARWTRLTNVRNDGHGEPGDRDHALGRRVYGLDGKRWPRLLIALYPHVGEIYQDLQPGLRIGVSRSNKPGEGWSDYLVAIPDELLDDVIGMIGEARVELRKRVADGTAAFGSR